MSSGLCATTIRVTFVLARRVDWLVDFINLKFENIATELSLSERYAQPFTWRRVHRSALRLMSVDATVSRNCGFEETARGALKVVQRTHTADYSTVQFITKSRANGMRFQSFSPWNTIGMKMLPFEERDKML